jgi:feruloyl-CoA synthase
VPPVIRFGVPRIDRAARPGGGFVLRARQPAPSHARCVGDWLVRWASDAPARTFLAERDRDGEWRRVTYADALAAVRGLAGALLALELSPRRPLLVLSGNSIEHALVALAAMHAGVPVAPVSPAYSLLSTDHRKLVDIAALLAPGAAFVAEPAAFAPALAALARAGIAPAIVDAAGVRALCATAPSPAADAAFAGIDGDTVAKLLFTSGSTGAPKGVVNTQRMLCANQAALAAGWPFLHDRPPVVVDWLPWSHTFGANHNLHLVLAHGGTLYVDAGRPAPGALDATLRNLREVSPTIYFNVPRGYDMLVAHLERDAALRARFFAELDVLFYAAAALSPATWDRLAALAAAAGRDVAMTSAWGSTETSPLVTQVCWAGTVAGNIGVPVPGVEVAFAPVGDRLEMRVRGASVAPGYLGADNKIEPLPRDELGFYPMGDAGRLVDDARPEAGIAFAGRTAENFKLASGTWVHVGEVRLALVAACAPYVADAAICGADRDELGAIVFLAADAPANVRDRLRAVLAVQAATGASLRIARVVIADEPPGIDAGEITDKGYLNQRAVRDRRAALVARLYDDGDGSVIRATR